MLKCNYYFPCSVQHGSRKSRWYDAHAAATAAARLTRCIWKHATKCSESTNRHGKPPEHDSESSQFPTTETAKSAVNLQTPELLLFIDLRLSYFALVSPLHFEVNNVP